jgi:uncharacterized phage infection (PIP) family protein YhgE
LNPIAPRLTNVTADDMLAGINSEVDQAKINLTSSTSGSNMNGLISLTSDQNDSSVNPVKLNKEVIDPVNNYGSAIAPFCIMVIHFDCFIYWFMSSL